MEDATRGHFRLACATDAHAILSFFRRMSLGSIMACFFLTLVLRVPVFVLLWLSLVH
jgi:hypothetical protein